MRRIRLSYPDDKGQISTASPRLYWESMDGSTQDDTLLYSLVVYAAPPDPKQAKRSKPQPLFIRNAPRGGFVDLPITAKGLKPGRTYWWQIRAQDQNGRMVGASEVRRFNVKEIQRSPGPVLAGVADRFEGPYWFSEVAAETYRTDSAEAWCNRENFVPTPPSLFGKPVRLRARSELDDSESEPDRPDDGPGSTGPLPLIWGSAVAADIYLPPYLAQHANIHWNLSHITGCDQVMLQISGPEGFSEANDGAVMRDSGMAGHYWGPPSTSCGDYELETASGPPPVFDLQRASSINLLLTAEGEPSPLLPSERMPDIVRQVRLVPCNDRREPVDVASDVVNVHCVRYPKIRISAQVTDWTWGESPGRSIEFALMLEEPFPRALAWDGSGRFSAATAPSTLLIYTAGDYYGLMSSCMANVSLTMDGEPVVRRNEIAFAPGRVTRDTFAIHLPEWPDVVGHNFRLEQEWLSDRGGPGLAEFLELKLIATVVPGISPDWNYCGGVFNDFDSLNGRDDLPEDPTRWPFYDFFNTEADCLPLGILTQSDSSTGLSEFNQFMESTFLGTRTVVHDGRLEDVIDAWVDEPAGTQEVEVRFESSMSDDFRYVYGTETRSVTMHETRRSGEVVWQVHRLSGRAAALSATGSEISWYAGREHTDGRSQFDPPRLQIWLSTRVGSTADFHGVWADVYYDLTAT